MVMRAIYEKFKLIDRIGKPFRFKIEGSDFRTSLGGIITIILTFSVVYSSYYFGEDIYRRKKPIVLLKRDLSREYPQEIVNNNNFFFGMSLDHAGEPMSDRRAFDYNLEYKFYENDMKEGTNTLIVKRQLEVESCSANHAAAPIVKEYHLHKFFCAQINNYTLGGSWEFAKSLGILTYRIKRCDKDTAKRYNITCLSDKELFKEYPGQMTFSTITEKTIINPGDHATPIKISFDYLDLKGYHEKKIFYNYNEVKTDNGLIFTDYSSTHQLGHSHSRMESNPLSTSSYKYKFTIYIDRLKNVYDRRYIKIQNIAAIVGGFMNLYMRMIFFFYNFYVENSYKVYMFNKLYNLEIDTEEEEKESEKEKKKEKEKEKKNVKIKNQVSKNVELKFSANQENQDSGFTNNQPLSLIDVSINQGLVEQKDSNINAINELSIKKDKKDNDDMKRMINHKDKKRVKMEVQWLENLKYMYCCSYYLTRNEKNMNRRRLELIAAAEKDLSQKTNAILLIDRFEQFHLMKKILFNESQCTMLENRDLKLIINKKYNVGKENDFIYEKKRKEEKVNLLKYLAKKAKENVLSDVDILFYKYLRPELKEQLKGTLKQVVKIDEFLS